MTGIELIRRVRGLEHRRRIPMIMVTGSLDFEVVMAALVAGADEVLHKPLHIPSLVEVVQKHVDLASERRSDA
jgi:CheY-like chemotaxis protein